MNINSIMLGLEPITNLPVEEADYAGKKAEYIVFNYADERFVEYGDDAPVMAQADIQIKMVLDVKKNYFNLKNQIKHYLLQNGAFNINCHSYVENADKGKIRNIIFECKFISSDI